MSKKHNATLKCPKCFQEYESEIWDSYNLQIEKNDITPIINNSIVTHTCPYCKTKAYLFNQIMFHDMERKTAIFFLPGVIGTNEELINQIIEIAKKQGMINYKIRIVEEDYDSFKEKILELTKGYDDKVCEIYKSIILKDEANVKIARFLFKDEKITGMYIMYSDGTNKVIKFQDSLYDSIKKEYQSLIKDEPNIVNQEYAERIIAKKQ